MKHWMLSTIGAAFNRWMELVREARTRHRLAFRVKDLKAQIEATEQLHYHDYCELTDEIVRQVAYTDELEVAFAD